MISSHDYCNEVLGVIEEENKASLVGGHGAMSSQFLGKMVSSLRTFSLRTFACLKSNCAFCSSTVLHIVMRSCMRETVDGR